jgi:hypothetical protein
MITSPTQPTEIQNVAPKRRMAVPGGRAVRA